MSKLNGKISQLLQSEDNTKTKLIQISLWPKMAQRALFQVLKGGNNKDAVEPQCTFALHLTADPWHQEEDPCVFFIYKTEINYVVDFSVHKHIM